MFRIVLLKKWCLSNPLPRQCGKYVKNHKFQRDPLVFSKAPLCSKIVNIFKRYEDLCVATFSSRLNLIMSDMKTDENDKDKTISSSASFSSSLCPRNALVLVDVQKEYWTNSSLVRKDFPRFEARIVEALRTFRENKNPIVHVYTDYSRVKSKWIEQFQRLNPDIPCILPFTTERVESFAEPEEGEGIVSKTGWSGGEALARQLRERNVETVFIGGLLTSVCVHHTAFYLFNVGFRVVLFEDCCADRGIRRHRSAISLYGNYMYELSSIKRYIAMR